MAEPFPVPTDLNDWAREMARAIVRLFGDEDTAEEIDKITQYVKGATDGTFWATHSAGRDEVLKDILALLKRAGALVGAGLGTTIRTYYGANAIGTSFEEVASGGGTEAIRKGAGDAVVKEIFNIFNIPGVASGYLNRQAGVEEQENFARFIGLNWQVQMADLIAEIASRWVPRDIAGGVREVGDRIQKVLGLEDAQEEIMEPLMEKLIVEGLAKRFNRETLPTDLTPNDAINAEIRGYITPAAMHLILDNEGLRKDIRDPLRKMQAKNLAETDLRDLYQRDIWNRGQVFQAYRENGYLDEEAELKTHLIEQDRLYKLKAELLNCKEAQFIAGVIDESSFRSFLATLGFDNAEEETEIEICKCKQTIKPGAKPKQITGSFNVTPERVKPGSHAIMKWNIRNAEEVFIEGIGNVDARGEIVITPTVSTTYRLTAKSDTDTEVFPAVVIVGDAPEVKKPVATLTVSPSRGTVGQPRELRWRTTGADSVTIDAFGPVEPSGLRVVLPIIPTFYTLTATNIAGSTVAQDVAFVSPPSIPEIERNQPKVSFAITPGVVSLAQAQSELKWVIENSDDQWLIAPDGSREKIPAQGVRIITSLASGVWEVEAQNQFGKTSRQEAVIFKGTPQGENGV